MGDKLDPHKEMDKYEKAALKTANKARAKLGLDPVMELSPGERQAAMSCVISNTIKKDAPKQVTVSTKSNGVRASMGGRTTRVRMSIRSKAFISKFDRGAYSKLSSGRRGWSGW